MTTITVISICLTAILAFLLGRCMYISLRRAKRLTKQKEEIKTLSGRLERIENSSRNDRSYAIEEDEDRRKYDVYLVVRMDTFCWCLIKSFPFDDDKEFAYNEAVELLDKLNEK